MVGNLILQEIKSQFVLTGNGFSKAENATFRVIILPDTFDPGCQFQIIDFMTLCHPGPNLFILEIDHKNSSGDEVVDEIDKLQKIFGDHMTQHLVVITENYASLCSLKEIYHLQLATPSDKLASDCRKWCSSCKPFLYDYSRCLTGVIERRTDELKTGR